MKSHYRLFFLTLLVFTMMLLPTIYAEQLTKVGNDWDNVESFIKDSTTSKYGKYEIKNTMLGIPFWKLDRVADIELKNNTDFCMDSCYAETEIVLYNDGILVDDIIFKELQNDKSWKEVNINSYHIFINGERYNVGDVVSAGTYNLRIDGKKDFGQTIDWVIKSNGIWTNEWAIWENSPIADGLVSYYKFDKNIGTVIDSLDNNNADNFGATRGVSGKINNSFDFELSEADYVKVNNSASLNPIDAISIQAWVNAESLVSHNTIIDKSNASTSGYFLWVRDDGTPYLKFEINSGGLGGGIATYSTSFPTSQWVHIVATYDKSVIRLYVDGTNVANTSYSSDIISNTNDLFFGKTEKYGLYWDGKIDEVGIWNRSLNATEIQDLYNSGVGFSYPFTYGQVILNSPNNNIISNNHTVKFNATASVTGANLVNMTLWTNETGSWQERNSTTGLSGTSSTQTWTRTLSDGSYLWNVRACDDDGDCGFSISNYTIKIESQSPIFNVESPSGTLNYNYIGGNETLNVTFTDENLDSCWYNYNGTNITIEGCLSGIKNSTLFTLEVDNMNMTIYANDTAGNINSTFISLDYKVFENSLTYNNITRVGDSEDFSLNLIVKEGYDLVSAVFHYNNYTESPSIYADGTRRILNVTDYAIPTTLIDTNSTLYFELLLDDSTEINTRNYTQLVQAISLDNCSSYTNILFNVSLVDEVSKESLNGDIEFYYNLLNVPAYNTINSTNLSVENVSNFAICSDINLTGQNYVQSIEIRYVADGYAPELYHIQRASISPDMTNIILYDINQSQSTEFKLTYQDDTFNFVEGAIIQLQRRYISDDSYFVVEAPLTSNEGIAVVHIDLNSVKYRATVVKDGEVLDTFNNLVFKCQSELTGECEQKILGEIDPQNTIDYDTERDFTYSVTPGYNNLTIGYTIPSSTPSSVNIVLTQKDQWGNITSCNKTIVSSGGAIQCNYNDSLDISYLELDIKKDDVPVGHNTYVVDENTGIDFFNDNFIIVVVLMLSLVGMAFTSPEWIILNGILTLVISGMLWLTNGMNFVVGLGIIMWLVIAAGILILKLSKQEDR